MNTPQRGTIALNLSPEAIRYLTALLNIDDGENTTEAIASEAVEAFRQANAIIDAAANVTTATYVDGAQS